MFDLSSTRGFKTYIKTARSILESNWTGFYTKPSPSLYKLNRGLVDYRALKASAEYHHYQEECAGLRAFEPATLTSDDQKLENIGVEYLFYDWNLNH